MHFNSITNHLGAVPNYFCGDILQALDAGSEAPGDDGRKFLGKGNKVLGFMRMQAPLRTPVSNLQNYLLSQQFPILKEKVPYELMVVKPVDDDSNTISSRYADRICELLVVPLRGTISISGAMGSENLIENLHLSTCYRINNRTPIITFASTDALAACFTFIDFDLKKYLMTWDLQSHFPAQSDEK